MRIHSSLAALAVAAVSAPAHADVRFVDDDANAGGDGLGWPTAYRFLQDALAEAAADPAIDEIRVAQGTYRPDQDEGGNVVPGDRLASFPLAGGVAHLGGYAGIGAPDPDDRDVQQYVTILSGDLLADDGPDFQNTDDNAVHVTEASYTDTPLTIDGFTITGASDENIGGGSAGLHIVLATPTVRDCSFSANRSSSLGAAIDASHASLSLLGCTFVNNTAAWAGAVFLFYSANAVIDDCTFDGNTANGLAGALYIVYHSEGYAITNCTFVNNSAFGAGAVHTGDQVGVISGSFFCDNTPNHVLGDWIDGGGNTFCPLCDDGAGAVLTVPGEYASIQAAVEAACDGAEVIVGPGTYLESINFGGKAILLRSSHGAEDTTIDAQGSGRTVLFASEETPSSILDGFTITGGGVFMAVASPTVRNCRIVGNTTEAEGGGMHIFGYPRVENCTFADNAAVEGGGLYVNVCEPEIINCTFTNNTAAERGGGIRGLGTTALRNCIVWGNSPDEIDAYPGRVPAVYCDVQGGWPGIGNIDSDPLFVDAAGGDLRLQPGSPCIDAGHNWAIAGHTETDLDGNPRFADGPAADTGCGVPVVVDMGGYEYPGSPFPVVLGDIDGDGVVSVIDFLMLLADWGPCLEDCCLADLDLDGAVDVGDFLVLLANWT